MSLDISFIIGLLIVVITQLFISMKWNPKYGLIVAIIEVFFWIGFLCWETFVYYPIENSAPVTLPLILLVLQGIGIVGVCLFIYYRFKMNFNKK